MSQKLKMFIKTQKCHKNWYVIQTEISPKLKSHQNWYVTKTEMSPNLKCHQNQNFTTTESSPKQKSHQNWSVTNTDMLPNIIMYSKIKIKIQEIGTEYLGIVLFFLAIQHKCILHASKCKCWNEPLEHKHFNVNAKMNLGNVYYFQQTHWHCCSKNIELGCPV